jgi:uncharacterized membrane protein HdeD (DUF308 family)
MNGSLLPHCFAFQGGSASSDAIPFLALIACSVIAGICTIFAGAKLQSTYKRGWLLIASGLLRAVSVFPFGIVGMLMIVAGAIEVAAAIRLRKHISGTIFLALAGIVSMLVFPMLLFVAVATGLGVNFPVLGCLTIISGACSLAFGLTMRSSRREAA